jgi:hypothetical protein
MIRHQSSDIESTATNILFYQTFLIGFAENGDQLGCTYRGNTSRCGAILLVMYPTSDQSTDLLDCSGDAPTPLQDRFVYADVRLLVWFFIISQPFFGDRVHRLVGLIGRLSNTAPGQFGICRRTSDAFFASSRVFLLRYVPVTYTQTRLYNTISKRSYVFRAQPERDFFEREGPLEEIFDPIIE